MHEVSKQSQRVTEGRSVLYVIMLQRLCRGALVGPVGGNDSAQVDGWQSFKLALVVYGKVKLIC